MLLKPTRVPSTCFNFRGGAFIAEMSDLGPDFQLGRVYDDACDEGFTMVSARTGKEVVFATSHQQIDGDGDLQLIELHSVTPGHVGYRAVLFND